MASRRGKSRCRNAKERPSYARPLLFLYSSIHLFEPSPSGSHTTSMHHPPSNSIPSTPFSSTFLAPLITFLKVNPFPIFNTRPDCVVMYSDDVSGVYSEEGGGAEKEARWSEMTASSCHASTRSRVGGSARGRRT